MAVKSLFYLGKSYLNLGQKINARKTLEKAQKLQDVPQISEAIQEIKLSDAEKLSYKYDVDLARVEEGL